jgi:hypothetical protein
MKTTTAIAMGAMLGAVAVGAGVWWGNRVNVAQAPPVPTAAAPAAPAIIAPEASAPAIEHPVPTLDSLGDAASHTFAADFGELLRRDPIGSLLRSDDFDHRFVATIDNLGRSAAPPSLWPVQPVKGQFQAASAPDGATLAPDNAARYLPFVLALERVDLHEAIRMYVWHYQDLQRQYEALGFPGHYFNDRFVQVLDQLLATPEPSTPPRVHLPQFQGTAPTRPWVLYEFDDPDLRSLSSGQRILIRMGLANERRVKHRLRELRRLLASSPADQEAIRQARAQERRAPASASTGGSQ